MIGPKPGFRITEVWAFTTIGDNNEEGIIGMSTPIGWMPFVAADRARLDMIKPDAQRIATLMKREVMLSKFHLRQDVETIKP